MSGEIVVKSVWSTIETKVNPTHFNQTINNHFARTKTITDHFYFLSIDIYPLLFQHFPGVMDQAQSPFCLGPGARRAQHGVLQLAPQQLILRLQLIHPGVQLGGLQFRHRRHGHDTKVRFVFRFGKKWWYAKFMAIFMDKIMINRETEWGSSFSDKLTIYWCPQISRVPTGNKKIVVSPGQATIWWVNSWSVWAGAVTVDSQKPSVSSAAETNLELMTGDYVVHSIKTSIQRDGLYYVYVCIYIYTHPLLTSIYIYTNIYSNWFFVNCE